MKYIFLFPFLVYVKALLLFEVVVAAAAAMVEWYELGGYCVGVVDSGE